jgi:flagellar biosynthesis protein FlhB
MMIYVVLAILLIVVVLFGLSSGMQSYATAQQARAQIEVAKVAQVNAWGNLISILILVLAIVAILALVLAILYWLIKRSNQRAARSGSNPTQRPAASPPPAMDLDRLTQLATLQVLMSLTAKPGDPSDRMSLPAPKEDQPADEDLFQWLR